ncbi:hypothetical protein SAMN04488514_101103 [Kriegella aquimaris]|uniref:Uncharacterized protein n=1 Tax=Kriegella aquimaris TaxID=192904 RepID=A0A1G9IEL1_9FLAO|nr:hypothetical protein SAMN04488514_101103 [Kriegella aquimaris]
MMPIVVEKDHSKTGVANKKRIPLTFHKCNYFSGKWNLMPFLK